MNDFSIVRVVTIVNVIMLGGLLASCGGGGGNSDSSSNTQAPTFAGIALVNSVSTDRATVAWMLATDDTTAVSAITYRVYLSTQKGFTPASGNQAAVVTGETQSVVTGLSANTTYYVRVGAEDSAGNRTLSDEQQVTTAGADPVRTQRTVQTSTNLKLPDLPAQQIDNSSYNFAKRTDTQIPASGSILIGSTTDGGGYLREVTGVSETASTVTVGVTSASLNDVFQSISLHNAIVALNVDASSSSKGALPQGMSTRTETLARGGTSQELRWRAGLLTIRTQNYASATWARAAGKAVSGKPQYTASTDGGELTLDAEIGFEPTIITDAQLSWGNLESATLEAKGTFNLNATLSYDFSGAVSVEQTKKLFKRTYTSVYETPAGVPVYQEITLAMDAKFTASAQGAIQAGTTADATATVGIGMIYQDGVWQPINEHSFEKSMTVSATVQGGVTAEVRLIPTIEVKFYKIVAGGFSLEPYLDGQASAELVQEADLINMAGFSQFRFTRLDASMGLDANTYAELVVFDNTIARWPGEDQTYTLFSLTYPLFSLPTMSLSGSGAPVSGQASYDLTGTVADGINDPFDESSIQWWSDGGTVMANAGDATQSTFSPGAIGQQYHVFFIGNGETIGSVGRQYAEITVDMRDPDGDGLPTVWENAYGLNPNDASDAAADPDGDSYSNLSEYQGSSDPTSAGSVPGGTGANQSPVADAGIDQSVSAGATVTLDGSASSDPDGSIASYAWTQSAGTTVTLSGAATAAPSFTAPTLGSSGTLTFQLTVTDNGGATATDTVDVTVSPGVVVNVADAAVTEGDSGTTDLTFRVSLSAQANGNVNVDYVTSDGTATAGSDYVATGGTLIIPASSTGAAVTVPVNGDTTYEPNEMFTLTLSNVSANAILGTATATGTIFNDDAGGTYGTGRLNDTGITLCGDYAYGAGSGIHNNTVDCATAGASQTIDGTETANGNDPVPAGQDALYGRDVTANDDTDGHAGFSFAKIDSSGNPLPASATSWDCVLDNVTGLMWEVKTDDSGLHDKGWTYTWYNSTGSNDGGSVGVPNSGSCVDSSNCDTEKYVAAVNTAGLCGHSDWRLPSVGELDTLVDISIGYPGPTIDTNWFPNTQGDWFWSSSPYVGSPSFAWVVGFFNGLELYLGNRYDAAYVRLVRSGN